MPIRPENRALYPPPKEWRDIRARILNRAGHKCERCAVPNYAVGYWLEDGRWRGVCVAPSYKAGRQSAADEQFSRDPDVENGRFIVIVLTIAHTNDPDPANCADDNLQALCQRCHNRLDMPMRQRNAAKTRRAGKAMGDLLEPTK